MTKESFRLKLFRIARSRSRYLDISHDFLHTERVALLAEKIGLSEGADPEILLPAALFHDAVVSPKHNPRSRTDSAMSAEFARNVLLSVPGYPRNKLEYVCAAITECSFKNGIRSQFLEGKILQDADGLDAIGALGIMRAFATTGLLRIPFYHHRDPFSQNRKPNQRLFGIDFFFSRMLVVESSMHTTIGRRLARQRTAFLRKFLVQLRKEFQQAQS